ncbi:uncharacterized protein [Nicotiana tomentosiformis]|uniref:uncharacterized protein n=1 Tax=Nicotiana tomentosiformis TaxID=4098 RepID=UPI00388C7163
MGNLAYLLVAERPLAMYAQALANRFVRLDVSEPSRVLACVVAQFLLLVRVKASQFDNHQLLGLKDMVERGGAQEVAIGDDGVMWLQGRICVPNVDGLRELILEEARILRYSIHPSATKMYCVVRASKTGWIDSEIGDTRVEVGAHHYGLFARVGYAGRAEYHISSSDEQSDRTIKILEDMLHAEFLPLAEFTYNNSYQSSIQMDPYEALYGRRCRLPISWFDLGDARLLGTDLVCDAMEKVKKIQEELHTAQSRQKSYANWKVRDVAYMVAEKVLLRVSPS